MNFTKQMPLKITGLIVLVIFLVSMVVATLYTHEGYVLEYGTNKPLKDVHVVAEWQGSAGIVDHVTACYHRASTKTDENGYFKIPKLSMKLGALIYSSNYISLYLFKPGYAEYFDPENPYRKDSDTIWYLEKFTGTTAERFESYPRLISRTICSNSGKSGFSAYPYFQSIFYEARSLAETSEQRKTVKRLREVAAWSAVTDGDYGVTGDTEQDVELFLRDNLK